MRNKNNIILSILLAILSLLFVGCSIEEQNDLNDLIENEADWNLAIENTLAAIHIKSANFNCEVEEITGKSWKLSLYADGEKARIDGIGNINSALEEYPTMYISLENENYTREAYIHNFHGKYKIDYTEIFSNDGAGSFYLREANNGQLFIDNISDFAGMYNDFIYTDGTYVLKEESKSPYFGVYLEMNGNYKKDLTISFQNGYVKTIKFKAYYRHALYGNESYVGEFIQTFNFKTKNSVKIPNSQNKLSTPKNVRIVNADTKPILMWDSVKEAKYYNIYGLNNGSIATQKNFIELYNLDKFDSNSSYEIKIQATGNRLFFLDSEFSIINYNKR